MPGCNTFQLDVLPCVLTSLSVHYHISHTELTMICLAAINSKQKQKCNLFCLLVPVGNTRITNLNETFRSSMPSWKKSSVLYWKSFCTVLINHYWTLSNSFKVWAVLLKKYTTYSSHSVFSHNRLYMQMSCEYDTLNPIVGYYVLQYKYLYMNHCIYRVGILINCKSGINNIRMVSFLNCSVHNFTIESTLCHCLSCNETHIQ